MNPGDTLTATPAPAEQWETIGADQICPGDDLEITRAWDGGSCTYRGRATSGPCNGTVMLGTSMVSLTISDLVSIRRRIHTPMPEPAAPAVVRHAGRLLARSEHCDTYQWLILAGPLDPAVWRRGAATQLAWAEVLALDPDTPPVVLDLAAEPTPDDSADPWPGAADAVRDIARTGAATELGKQADWLEGWAARSAPVTPEDRRIYGLVARRLRARAADLQAGHVVPASPQPSPDLGAELDAEPTAPGTVVQDGKGVWLMRNDAGPGEVAWMDGAYLRPWDELPGPVRFIRDGGPR